MTLTKGEDNHLRISICKVIKSGGKFKNFPELYKRVGLNPRDTIEKGKGRYVITTMKKRFMDRIFIPKYTIAKGKLGNSTDIEEIEKIREKTYEECIKIALEENRIPIIKDKRLGYLVVPMTIYDYLEYRNKIFYRYAKIIRNQLEDLSTVDSRFPLTDKRSKDLEDVMYLFFRDYLDGDFK